MTPFPIICALLASAPPLASATVEEHLGSQVSPAAVFRDSDGRRVSLGELFDGQLPVVLTLAYYRCSTLCSLVLDGVAQASKGSGLVPGKDFRLVTVSIDPTETPAQALDRKRVHAGVLHLDEAHPAWRFLVGEEEPIRKLAGETGFGYSYDEDTRQYAHAAVVMVLTPGGRLSRYFYGMQFRPRDLRLALVEAANGRVGTSFDRVLLTCFKYDPVSRRYGLYVQGFVKGGAFLTFAALATLLGVLWRREAARGEIR